MAVRVTPHPCALPGCEVITRNAKYCCKEHQSLGQVITRDAGERACAHCHQTKPAGDFIHVNPSGERRLRSWCRECREMLSQTAQDRRTATIRARAEKRRETETPRPMGKEPSLVVVDAKGRNKELTWDQIDLGGLPGTSVWAHPWPA